MAPGTRAGERPDPILSLLILHEAPVSRALDIVKPVANTNHHRRMFLIAKSRIQGQGLFTDAPLPARRKIGEFTGERISVREARRRARGAKRIAIIEISSTKAIDGGVDGGPFQFVNHSCDPNIFIRVAYGRAEFYTKRPLTAGEELTCDYGESHHDGKLPCRCGSAHCKKFI